MRPRATSGMRPAAVAPALVLSLVLWCAPAAAQDNGPPAVRVETAPLASRVVHPRREAPAQVVARNQSRISAEIAAVVREISADVGQAVAAEAPLARLDDRDTRLALRQVMAERDGLRARLELAQRQLDRARELESNNFIATEAVNQRSAEVVSLRAELNAVEARVAVAQRQLDKTVVRAPYDAVVSARSAQVGELTSPGAPLFTLVQRGDEEVHADIPAERAGSLLSAARIVFVSDGPEHVVELVRVSPVISGDTRTRAARLRFVERPPAIGTDGRLRWADPAPHLPPALIVRRGDVLGAFTVRDGRARFVALPGAQEGRAAPVALPPDTPIVVSGQAALRDGDPVRH